MKKKVCIVCCSFTAILAIGLASMAVALSDLTTKNDKLDYAAGESSQSTEAQTESTTVNETLMALLTGGNSKEAELMESQVPETGEEDVLPEAISQDTLVPENAPSVISEEDGLKTDGGTGKEPEVSKPVAGSEETTQKAAEVSESSQAAEETKPGASVKTGTDSEPSYAAESQPGAQASTKPSQAQTSAPKTGSAAEKPSQAAESQPGTQTSMKQPSQAQTSAPKTGSTAEKPSQASESKPGTQTSAPKTGSAAEKPSQAAEETKQSEQPKSGAASKTAKECVGSDHVFLSEWVVTKQPTCSEYGTQVRTCQCGQTTQSRFYGEPTGRHQYAHQEKAATCEEAGYSYDICQICGKKINVVNVPANGHKYQTHVIPATCKTSGSSYDECTVCQKRTNEKTIAKLTEHSWGPEEGPDPTCTTSGYKYQVCTVCGKHSEGRRVERTGHNYVDTGNNVAATCTTPALVEKRCENCGDIIQVESAPALRHNFSSSVIKESANCQHEGLAVYTCSRCGITKDVVLKKTDHRWVLNPDREGLSHCADCGIEFGK